MIKLIVFDFDGTLGDTRANIVNTMRDTMLRLSLPVAEEETIAATIGLPLEKGFARLYPSPGLRPPPVPQHTGRYSKSTGRPSSPDSSPE